MRGDIYHALSFVPKIATFLALGPGDRAAADCTDLAFSKLSNVLEVGNQLRYLVGHIGVEDGFGNDFGLRGECSEPLDVRHQPLRENSTVTDRGKNPKEIESEQHDKFCSDSCPTVEAVTRDRR